MRQTLLKRAALLGVLFVAGSSFAIAQTFCTVAGGALPDNDPLGVDFPIDVPDSGSISDVDVSVDITHTWAGDLRIVVGHIIAVVPYDRPGVPLSTFGCGGNDIDAILNDEGVDGPVEDMCSDLPAIFGEPTPNEALSAFDGLEGFGTWTINVSDNAGGDTGTVNEICVIFDPPLPVEMTSFTSQVNGTSVTLNWETASETNNAGFEVQTLTGENWVALDFVAGHGTTTEAQTYSFGAGEMGVGTHAFRLKQIDFDGAFEYSDEVEATIETPGTHVLSAAYPNPFNPQSNFTLAVAQDQQVTAELFNTLGQRVAVLFNGTVEANQTQTVTIDGAGLASGMYVVRVHGESFSDALSVTLLK